MNDQEAKQAIFNYVVSKARKMNERCGEDGRCFYRAPNGNNKCFIGHLLPNNYNPDDLNSLSLKKIFKDICGISISNKELMFFILLQEIHDEYPINSWEKEFQRFAEIYDLTVPTHT